jgi:hypothetical protein
MSEPLTKDPLQPEPELVSRLDSLYKEMEKRARAKKAAYEYFQKNNMSMKGFTGDMAGFGGGEVAPVAPPAGGAPVMSFEEWKKAKGGK